MGVQLAAGFLLSTGIGVIAYRLGSLSRSGVAGAILTGTAIFGFGGWAWGMLLIAFFVSSSALSRWGEPRKASAAEKFAKGSRRDLGQALANGGAGAGIALTYAVRPDPLLIVAFAGAMASVTADTWATEIGTLSAQPPRLITTGRTVAPGTSGGVSLLGVLASLAGAAFIGLLAAFLFGLEGSISSIELLYLPVVATVAGLVASLFDSLLGATVQAMYYCDTCGQETERVMHRCGSATRALRGWSWLDNDAVNFASSVLGALLATLLAIAFG